MVKYRDFIKNLSVGMEVRCKLDTYDTCENWFTGVIHHIDGVNIDIVRDDGRTGAGEDDSWSILLTKKNMPFLQIIPGDWDE